MKQIERPPKVTRDAMRKCLEWLDACNKLGWHNDQLDDLESLWWKYHDEQGESKTPPTP